ncbi:MAG: ABC transporter substrate-binding protein [bacterium]|jgi:ABC-type Fe3+ transport system substrate-binding protein|nr:extracellular solute-binding protein [Planctomycetaceae bacterium]
MNNLFRWVILGAFLAIIAVPFFAARGRGGNAAGVSGGDALLPPAPRSAGTLVIVTPHVEQIRQEFAFAFDRWHRRVHGESITIDYRTPGGTTEILKLLEAGAVGQMQRLVDEVRQSDPDKLLDESFSLEPLFQPGMADFDLMFGGGTFDHDRLRSRGAVVSASLGLSGSGTVRLDRPRERLRVAALTVGKVRQIETRARFAAKGKERSLLIRIPTNALLGGAEALLPLAADGENRESVEVTADLSRLERVLMVRLSAPPEPAIDEATLARVYGENVVGAGQLWQDHRGAPSADGTRPRPADWQHWFGTALSGFGIVFNRDLIRELGMNEPRAFTDLGDFRYFGMLALADPRQSGSVATAYDSILNEEVRAATARAKAAGATDDDARTQGRREGWEKGWRTLREMAANARYFAQASTMPPMDVSQGEAAAGVVIDFYGRGQAQAVMRSGESVEAARVGYIDPVGAVYIDADPVSILRGSANAALARRFVEFCLTDEAQALWQFPTLQQERAAGRVPRTLTAEDAAKWVGPVEHRLRRMPVRRAMYADPAVFGRFFDKVDPFNAASSARPVGWRDGMITMMGAFGVDSAEELRAAWAALNRARSRSDFPADRLAEMERLFYAFPSHIMLDETEVPFTPDTYAAISEDTRNWRDPEQGTRAKVRAVEEFRAMFRRVVELERAGG